ncbi:MAG: hypothetical protein J6X18_02200 [Bacteroidales bacterium]|nr:hypothetical protein [Bacteroidales bacterium]
MKKNFENNNITSMSQLREAVREIVSERVYSYLNEAIDEQWLENDEKTDDDKEEKTSTKSNMPSTDAKDAAKKRKQVTQMLRDPKINMAELGRDLYPEMSDDASRSLISKKSRGVRELTPDEIITLYQKLRGTKVG